MSHGLVVGERCGENNEMAAVRDYDRLSCLGTFFATTALMRHNDELNSRALYVCTSVIEAAVDKMVAEAYVS